MKQIIVLSIIIGFGINLNSYAQKDESEFGIKFSGFVKNDFFFDTRQTVSAREGHFLLFPANEKLSIDGEDINAKSNFNFLSIQSRLTGKISGPDAFGAKTSGVIEGAFFGHTDSDINGFRLRHAFFKLNWENTELLTGQYWHMMFVPGCFPGTVSFNTGVPFQYFTRNPQIRLTHKMGNLSIAGMVAAQRDFAGPGGSAPLRNSAMPDLQAQLTYNGENLLAGVTAGYKKVMPRLQTDSLYKTTTTIGGFTGQAFLKISSSALTWKVQATYLENGYDGLSLGGFAVREITDPNRDFREYTTINTLSLWTDIHTNGSSFQAGLFAGYSKNLGASDKLESISSIATYTRGWNIANLFRVSPRIILNRGKTRFAFEYELTGAAYGSSMDDMGVPQDLSTQINNRLLLSAYYFF